MKKLNLAALALLGLSAGLIASGCHQSGDRSGNKTSAAEEELNDDMQAFYASLSPAAQQKFLELDAQHRMMVIQMMNQPGTGQNSCKGMGGCKTTQHTCAGLNACKGQGGPRITDPNKAVDVQYRNQVQQRKNLNNSMQQPSIQQASCGSATPGSYNNQQQQSGGYNYNQQSGPRGY